MAVSFWGFVSTLALSRAFKMPVEDKIYESIQENLKEI